MPTVECPVAVPVQYRGGLLRYRTWYWPDRFSMAGTLILRMLVPVLPFLVLNPLITVVSYCKYPCPSIADGPNLDSRYRAVLIMFKKSLPLAFFFHLEATVLGESDSWWVEKISLKSIFVGRVPVSIRYPGHGDYHAKNTWFHCGCCPSCRANMMVVEGSTKILKYEK